MLSGNGVTISGSFPAASVVVIVFGVKPEGMKRKTVVQAANGKKCKIIAFDALLFPYLSPMKVCGFSFVRNGLLFDYPFAEAIRSILPVCDHFIVAVGNSTDGTAEAVRAIDPKIQVIDTIWDDSLRAGGRVLAVETDKAFQAIPPEYDWAFYVQGDEVVHEKYLPVIREALAAHHEDARVEGLLFQYTHFFGGYNYVGLQHSWYRREIRLIRNQKDIFSYRDAQGFRKAPNRKLRVKLIDAWVFHYGYVREPEALQKKETSKVRMYHDDSWIARYFQAWDRYQFEKLREPVAPFSGTHPAVMKDRIARQNWAFNPDLTIRYSGFKDWIKRTIGKLTGWYPGEYRNYKIVRF